MKNETQWRRIRIDWEELVDAFEDGSSDHRYYLDRETGAVHFFSAYLDNDEEEEDERLISSEDRYVQIPQDKVAVSEDQVAAFVASLDDGRERRALSTALRAPGGHERFREAVAVLPKARREWKHFSDETTKTCIEEWLSEVSVEPL